MLCLCFVTLMSDGSSATCQISALDQFTDYTRIDIRKQEDTQQPWQCISISFFHLYNNLFSVHKISCFWVGSHVRDAVCRSTRSGAGCCSSVESDFLFCSCASFFYNIPSGRPRIFCFIREKKRSVSAVNPPWTVMPSNVICTVSPIYWFTASFPPAKVAEK